MTGSMLMTSSFMTEEADHKPRCSSLHSLNFYWFFLIWALLVFLATLINLAVANILGYKLLAFVKRN